MTFPIGLLLAVAFVALVLFAFDWIAADVVAIGLMLALVLLGLVPVDKAFVGFGSDTSSSSSACWFLPGRCYAPAWWTRQAG
jgi:di/tricarboxylate transporter